MTPARTAEVLRLIAARASRDELHGQSLRSLRKRGFIRAEYTQDEKGGLQTKHYVTNAGRAFLAELSPPVSSQAEAAE